MPVPKLAEEFLSRARVSRESGKRVDRRRDKRRDEGASAGKNIHRPIPSRWF
jgi:hypothetical protein